MGTPLRTPSEPPSSISVMTGEVVDRVRISNRIHDSLQRYQDQVGKLEQWTMSDGLLLHDGKLVVPDDGDLRARLLDEMHRLPSTAHPGEDKLAQLFRTRFYWPGWTADIHRYVDNCQICKRTKNRLLHPLPIPTRPWQHISIDFCSLPKDKHGFDNVTVVVDRFSKRTISIPCHKTITAEQTARLFVDHILRWVGCPGSIVSDRGPQFISEFWKTFCDILKIKRKLSTAHHPQTDGQTEIANKYMEQRLRPYINYHQDDWSEHLWMVDFAVACL